MKFFISFLIIFSTIALAQVRPPVPNPIPTPPVDFAQSTLCKQTCANGVQYQYFMTIGSTSGVRNCPDLATTVRNCSPYACENKSQCRINCNTQADCAKGFACITGQCMSISYYCSDDVTSNGTDGRSWDCSPYICQSGSCLHTCQTGFDCAQGYLCDTEFHKCVPQPHN